MEMIFTLSWFLIGGFVILWIYFGGEYSQGRRNLGNGIFVVWVIGLAVIVFFVWGYAPDLMNAVIGRGVE